MSAPRSDVSQLFVLTEATQRRLDAFAYVNAPNTPRYRTIARFLLHTHDRLRDWVPPEEIFDGVRRWLDGDYTIEALRADLQTMVNWQAIVTDQDKRKPTSLQAFYQTRLVYRLAPATIEFERLLKKLDMPATSGGVLNATLLQRLTQAVEHLNVALDRIAKQGPLSASELQHDIVEPWNQVIATLRDLQEGARDFYQTLGTALPADAASLGPFQIYKDALRTYLTGFLWELQDHRPRLVQRFERWRAMAYVPLLTEMLARHDVEQRVAYLAPSGAPLSQAEIADQIHGPALAGVMAWLDEEGGAATLVEKTKNAILFIVTQNERLVSRHAVGNSRRRDLERLAHVFARLDLVNAPSEVADQLWARAMGAMIPRHLRGGSSEQAVLVPNESAWLQTPIEYPLRAYRRGQRPQRTTAKVMDDGDALAEARAEAEQEIEYERKLWDRLLRDGVIDTTKLFLEDEHLRGPILNLIAAARLDPDGIAITRDGRQIRIEPTLLASPAPAVAPAVSGGEHDHDDTLASMGRIVAPDGTFYLDAVRLIVLPRIGEDEVRDEDHGHARDAAEAKTA